MFALEPGADAAERLRQLEPRWARDAIPIEARAGDLAVRAFLSPPMARRGAASRLLLFLNGRPIKDRRLFHAVTEAYRRLSSLSGTPKAYVFVEAPPDAVDVNVHPAKSEVRFADPEAAWGAVFRGVRAGLEDPRSGWISGWPAAGDPDHARKPGCPRRRQGNVGREPAPARSGCGRPRNGTGEGRRTALRRGPGGRPGARPGTWTSAPRRRRCSASSGGPTSSPRSARSCSSSTSTRRTKG